MDRNFSRALPLVLRHEGGFVDNAKDPGGATNKGVTLAAFRAYVKPDGTEEELKRISDEQVATVYYRHYWAACQAHRLPSGLDYAVFDFAVNSGPKRAAQYLQGVLGVNQDGRVGPKTIAAAEAADAAATIRALCDARLAFMKRIKHRQTGEPLWKTFGRGWQRRVDEVRRHALAMVGKPADVQTVRIDKPTVPEEVDEEVKKKTGLWEKITGLFGFGGVGGGMLFGVEWQTLAIIAGVAIVVLLLIVLLRRQIIGAVRDIRAAVASDFAEAASDRGGEMAEVKTQC